MKLFMQSFQAWLQGMKGAGVVASALHSGIHAELGCRDLILMDLEL